MTAAGKTGPPWIGPPDFFSEKKCVFSPEFFCAYSTIFPILTNNQRAPARGARSFSARGSSFLNLAKQAFRCVLKGFKGGFKDMQFLPFLPSFFITHTAFLPSRPAWILARHQPLESSFSDQYPAFSRRIPPFPALALFLPFLVSFYSLEGL
ncbi:MAG TPA: hypothetical protein PK054_09625 [Anaerohalosphaeraceae bacterium]|nr:hypothetical protein [Anaerohalosphaeraceae bacterium]HOL89869.1 hypothetical protein [Anaerohalosphaeraceae bacterium]HPP56822.1 hypothetical protein [Anaerohalosphaeraceae bacterium]